MSTLTSMHVSELPARTQDYLKVLWDFEEHHGGSAPMALGELSKAVNQKTPTTSEAVKRLVKQGLVVHERYLGVELTRQGRELAVAMARRHRLLETFLVDTLGYAWDEVHADADQLEHACSDRFIDRLDAFLGHPARDPHGDPIPAADGTSEPLSSRRLSDVPTGETAVMEQVDDADPGLLRYLQENDIRPGTELAVVSGPSAGLIHVEVSGGGECVLAEVAAQSVTVR